MKYESIQYKFCYCINTGFVSKKVGATKLNEILFRVKKISFWLASNKTALKKT